MRERPVFHEELGDFFVKLREDRRWSLRQAADMASRRGYSALTRQILFRLEKGQIKNPEPSVLRDAAKLYEWSYDDLVRRFFAARYGVDVFSQPDTMTVPTGTELARTPEETEMLRAFRTIADPAVRLLVRDTIARFTDTFGQVKKRKKAAERTASR